MNLFYTGRFKKDFKRMMRRNEDENQLWEVVEILQRGKPIPQKYRDHPLSGNWKNRRECHIEPDWLLVYCVKGDDLILERTGTHSDLFR